jgi:drug/metabolite transporter (DMT)-like permease
LIGYFAALTAALCWSFGGLIAVTPVNRLGSIRFNRIRMPMVFVLLSAMAFLTDGWNTIQSDYFLYILFSSIVGIFLGDTALFYTMNKMGPRRTAILFATNAPMTAIISFIVFNETLTLQQITGCSIVMFGVFLAIVFGTTANQTHVWEQVKGSALIGILAGLFASLCQATGALIIKPVMEDGADAVTISALRVGISAILLISIGFFRGLKNQSSPNTKLTPRLMLLIAGSGFVGMAMGMTLLLFGLARGEAGIVTTLSATTPVMMLPLLWIKTRERPALGSWLGALLTVVGSAVLFNF